MLASEILGHINVLAIELQKDRCYVLEKSGWFPDATIVNCDIGNFDWTEWEGMVDCLCAGFPCQDISTLGSGKGLSGEKSKLVFEVFRAVDVIRPEFVFLENTPAILSRGRDIIIGEFERRDYMWKDCLLSAYAIGAPHKRRRWWFLAKKKNGTDCVERNGVTQQSILCELRRSNAISVPTHPISTVGSECVDSAEHSNLGICIDGEIRKGIIRYTESHGYWSERIVGAYDGMDVRLPPGMDNAYNRLAIAAIGDSQVPLVAAAAFEFLRRVLLYGTLPLNGCVPSKEER